MNELEIIKMSIIIPVYNGEKYLEQCIKSALRQTLKELEIICVDDGSTDDSMCILRQMQKIDTRITIYHQNNLGAGAARNLALTKARGKYVAFLDADDFYMDNSALELMYEACEEKGVSVCASAKRHMINRVTHTKSTIEVFRKNEIGTVLSYKEFQIDYYYQNYIFLRKFLVEHNILFPIYRRYQDPPFFVKAFFLAEHFVAVDTCLYCYRATEDRPKFNSKKTEDLLKGIIDNLIFAEQNELDILFRNTAKRLDDDFAMIIYENMSLNRLNILDLLLKCSQMIGEKYNNPAYVVKPLRLLLIGSNQYEKKLLKDIEMQKEITIYGAGKYGQCFLRFLKKNKLSHKVKNVVVSNLNGNVDNMNGIPVISLERFLTQEDRQPLIVTVNSENSKAIVELLNQNSYMDYRVLDELFWEQLLQENEVPEAEDARG